MLEVIHLSKVYKTKGGADVKALDDVSVKFPETGMVFLLGRSGSGKSTLLNVCGGLDSPSEGEIVVKGRSSRDFTQSDFDSYRNTFVGFVFQEYNILNEFTVEDNIALALELQGKPKDKNAIAALLEEVDLTGYAKRKPNTLSGGQKQRIAIARALVKNPEIIMADEPTGALDSATGKQVFDTLKKLSKQQLVIVVSHDRDFAEQYGDRVIELKDGKIISDVTKAKEESRALSSNITSAGETLCIKSGAALSDADFREIKAFLSRAEGNVVIASGEKDVKTFRQAARISDDGAKEVFKNTVNETLPVRNYTSEENRFIRSRLPARHAFRIGASGLKTKPLRLFFTILLSTVAFVMFGLLSTMMTYDKQATMKKSLQDSHYSSLLFKKEYTVTTYQYTDGKLDYSYDTSHNALFTEQDVQDMSKRLGGDTFAAFSFGSDSGKTVSNILTSFDYYSYYKNKICFVAYLPASHSLRNRIVAGSYPAEGRQEICISSFLAESILNGGLYDPESVRTYELNDAKDLVGKKLSFSGSVYTVSGIFDSGRPDSKFDSLKKGNRDEWELGDEWNNEFSSSLHSVAFIDESTEKLFAENGGTFDDDLKHDFENRYYFTWSSDKAGMSYSPGLYAAYRAGISLPSVFFDADKKDLLPGETLVNATNFPIILDTAVTKQLSEIYDYDYELYAEMNSAFYDDQYEEETDSYTPSLYSKAWSLQYATGDELTTTQSLGYINDIASFIEKYDVPFEIMAELSSATKTENRTLKIVGFFSETDYYYSDYLFYLNKEEYEAFAPLSDEIYGSGIIDDSDDYNRVEKTDYVEPEGAIYPAVFITYDRSERLSSSIAELTAAQQADGSFIVMQGPLSDALEEVDYVIEDFSEVFLYIGLILAVFAALLLCNFISVSITYKKKEIGILRAVGARSLDVFKIFFSESLIITAFCVVLSTIGGIVICSVLNMKISSLLSGVSIFVFGPLSVLMLIAVALLTAVLATFLPVWNAARKKPVESIRAL